MRYKCIYILSLLSTQCGLFNDIKNAYNEMILRAECEPVNRYAVIEYSDMLDSILYQAEAVKWKINSHLKITIKCKDRHTEALFIVLDTIIPLYEVELIALCADYMNDKLLLLLSKKLVKYFEVQEDARLRLRQIIKIEFDLDKRLGKLCCLLRKKIEVAEFGIFDLPGIIPYVNSEELSALYVLLKAKQSIDTKIQVTEELISGIAKDEKDFASCDWQKIENKKMQCMEQILYSFLFSELELLSPLLKAMEWAELSIQCFDEVSITLFFGEEGGYKKRKMLLSQFIHTYYIFALDYQSLYNFFIKIKKYKGFNKQQKNILELSDYKKLMTMYQNDFFTFRSLLDQEQSEEKKIMILKLYLLFNGAALCVEDFEQVCMLAIKEAFMLVKIYLYRDSCQDVLSFYVSIDNGQLFYPDQKYTKNKRISSFEIYIGPFLIIIQINNDRLKLGDNDDYSRVYYYYSDNYYIDRRISLLTQKNKVLSEPSNDSSKLKYAAILKIEDAVTRLDKQYKSIIQIVEQNKKIDNVEILLPGIIRIKTVSGHVYYTPISELPALLLNKHFSKKMLCRIIEQIFVTNKGYFLPEWLIKQCNWLLKNKGDKLDFMDISREIAKNIRFADAFVQNISKYGIYPICIHGSLTILINPTNKEITVFNHENFAYFKPDRVVTIGPTVFCVKLLFGDRAITIKSVESKSDNLIDSFLCDAWFVSDDERGQHIYDKLHNDLSIELLFWRAQYKNAQNPEWSEYAQQRIKESQQKLDSFKENIKNFYFYTLLINKKFV